MNDDALIAALADALQSLMDEQHGPPLIRRAGEWNEAMVRAQELLTIVNSRSGINPLKE